MSKTKQKNHKNETEYLNSKLKEKDKLIKSLTRRVKYLEKRDHNNDREDIEISQEETKAEIEEFSGKCPNSNCGGSLTYTDVGVGILDTCTRCTYRKLNRHGF
jgi:hypothetical protein